MRTPDGTRKNTPLISVRDEMDLGLAESRRNPLNVNSSLRARLYKSYEPEFKVPDLKVEAIVHWRARKTTGSAASDRRRTLAARGQVET